MIFIFLNENVIIQILIEILVKSTYFLILSYTLIFFISFQFITFPCFYFILNYLKMVFKI